MIEVRRDSRGLGLVSTLLLLTGIAGFLAAVGLLVSQERARVRDSQRLVDMIRVQFAFETLYREKASYAEAAVGCGQVGMAVSTCQLSTYLPTIAALKDPGRGQYRVEKVPDEKEYAISFVLERGYEALGPGRHTVSRNGIQ